VFWELFNITLVLLQSIMLLSFAVLCSSHVILSDALVDGDDTSLLQAQLQAISRLESTSSSPTARTFVVGVGAACPTRYLRVWDSETCKAFAKSVEKPIKIITHKNVETLANNQDVKYTGDGCVYERMEKHVIWNGLLHGEGRRNAVCMEQNVKSEGCLGKRCELRSFPIEDVDKELEIGTGVGVPATLRGLWYMDGNPVADEIFSMSTEFVEEAGNTVVGKLNMHATNRLGVQNNEDGESLLKLLSYTEATYEVRCKYEGSFDKVTYCTISPSLFGSSPLPSDPNIVDFNMSILPVDDPDHIPEDGENQEEQLTFKRGSSLFGRSSNYMFRRVVDQHGRRLAKNWNHFINKMTEQGLTSLSRIHATEGPVESDLLKSRILPMVGRALLGIAVPVLQDGLLFGGVSSASEDLEGAEMQSKLMRVLKIAGSVDVTEFGGCSQTIEARLKRAMEAGVKYAISEGSENPLKTGISAVFFRLIGIFKNSVHVMAYEDGGKVAINPATNNVLLRESPLPYPLSAVLFSWDGLLDIVGGFVGLPLFRDSGNRTSIFSQLAEMGCFETMPLAQGPMVFKYDKVVGDLTDPAQARGYFMSASRQHRQTFNVDSPLFRSSNSPQHKDLRVILENISYARQVPVPLDTIKTLVPVNRSVDARTIGTWVFAFSQLMIYGVMPDRATIGAVLGYLVPGTLGVFGELTNTLIMGPRMVDGEPSMEEQLLGYRKAGLAFAKTTPFAANLTNNRLMLEFIEKYPGVLAAQPYNEFLGYDTEKDHFLMNLVDAGLFAGLIGTNDATSKCIAYQVRDQNMEDSFNDEPQMFMIELMRYDSAVTSFTATYKEDTDEVLEGKRIKFKKGTPYQSVIAVANRDPVQFPDPHKFDAKRDNPGDVLSWNGKLKDVEKRDLVNAPRHCPGHCLSLKLAATLCARFMGSPDEVFDKIGTDINCANAGKR